MQGDLNARLTYFTFVSVHDKMRERGSVFSKSYTQKLLCCSTAITGQK